MDGNIITPSTYQFQVGTTVVTWRVTDDTGQTASDTQNISIADNQKPTISAPTNVTVDADTNSCTTSGVALGTPSTSDNCWVKNVSNNAPATFPLGNTTVTWTVTDNSGNTETATQTVKVSDNEKPEITHNGNKTVDTDAGQCGGTVSVSAICPPFRGKRCVRVCPIT